MASAYEHQLNKCTKFNDAQEFILENGEDHNSRNDQSPYA
jgi:hypothetical protein